MAEKYILYLENSQLRLFRLWTCYMINVLVIHDASNENKTKLIMTSVNVNEIFTKKKVGDKAQP